MRLELVHAIVTMALAGAALLALVRLFARVDILERQAKETERHLAAVIEIVHSLSADVRQLKHDRDRDGFGPE